MRILGCVLSLCLLWVDTAQPVEVELFRGVVAGPHESLIAEYRGPRRGGLYVSRDAGKTFGMLCSPVLELGLFMSDIRVTHQRPDGKLYAGTFNGLFMSDDTLCSWKRVPMFEGRWLMDIASDPSDPGVTYAITNTNEAHPSALFRNDGGSDTWTQVSEKPGWYLTRLFVVPTPGGKRFYQSALVPGGASGEPSRYFIRVSDDGGATWAEHEYPVEGGEMRLLAIDPMNPDRIVLGVTRPEGMVPDDLVYSSMRGEPGSFTTIGQVVDLAAVAFTPDGTLFFGDNESASKALFKVSALGEAPQMVRSDYRVGCLHYHPAHARLYMCSDFTLGTLDPATGEYTTLTDMRRAEAFVACPDQESTAKLCEADSMAGLCKSQHYEGSPLCQKFYSEWVDPVDPVASIGGASGGASGVAGASAAGSGAAAGAGSEAGSSPSGAGAAAGAGGTNPTPPTKDGCGVAVGSEPSSGGAPLLLMAAVAIYLWRRRRAAIGSLAISLAVLAAPSHARAGPIEVLSTVEVASSDPKRIVTRWTFGDGGMYVSSDGGASFQATCFGALGANVRGTDVMAFKTAGDGSICVGTQDGVHCSNDRSCGWKEAPEVRGQWVADFATDPVDPNRLYFVTGTSQGKNGIYARDAAGETWRPFGTHLNAWFTRLHVVKHGESKRFYVSSLENVDEPGEDGGVSTQTHYYLRYSDDEGASWTSHRYDAVPQRSSLRLVAVDPSDVRRIVIATLRPADNLTDALLFSDRAGEPGSFTKIGEVVELGGVAFAPDGTLYYGDNFAAMPGLYKVEKLGEPPVTLHETLKVSCLGFDPAGERLYACSDWLLGTIDPSTGALDTMFDLREASELLRCEGETTTAHACSVAFLPPNFCDGTHYPKAPICARYFGGASGAGAAGAGGQGASQAGRGPAGAGGAAGAAGTAPSGGEGSDDGGCGCVAAGARRGPGARAVAIGLVLGLVSRLARRRRR